MKPILFGAFPGDDGAWVTMGGGSGGITGEVSGKVMPGGGGGGSITRGGARIV